eukprot:941838_1
MKRKPDVPPTSGIQPSAKRTVIDLSGPQPNANFTPAATQRRRNMPTFTPNYSTPGLRSVQPNVSRATPANSWSRSEFRHRECNVTTNASGCTESDVPSRLRVDATACNTTAKFEY